MNVPAAFDPVHLCSRFRKVKSGLDMFGHIEVITAFERNTIAEFFYYVKYGSTIITSKNLVRNFSLMKIKK